MKCIQKLCHRTKNINTSGNCNVCDSVIEEIKKKTEGASKKKFHLQKIELDLKMMVDTHKKLVNGSQVDTKVVNTLLFGGVVNILHQSEAFEDVEERVKAIEREDVTNKAKIEYLENWVLRQNDTIEKLNEKLSRLDENGVFVKEAEDLDSIQKR